MLLRGMEMFEDRHPGTTHLLRFFSYVHLPMHAQIISASCSHLAQEMVSRLPDGPELTVGLRKLLEAKDCFVRAAVEQGEKNESD